MNEKHFPELVAEIKNWGPSPFAPENAEPVPIYFYNEVGGITGITTYSGFGRRAPTYLLTTSFRLILYEKRKRGRDRCRSYWHNIDFGEWRWRDNDGFVISGVRTTPIEFKDPTGETPYFAACWQTYFVSPAGDRKLLEEVTVLLRHYYLHQEHRYVRWDETVSLPNFEYRGSSSYPAVVPFCYKIKLQTMGTGTIDLDALWLLHTNPPQASLTKVGYIPPDSALHPDNATRKREKHDLSKINRGSRRKKRTAHPTRTAAERIPHTDAQARDAMGMATEGRDMATETPQPTSKIKFCGNCGAPVTPGANFCGKCGTRLTQTLSEGAKNERRGNLKEKVREEPEGEVPLSQFTGGLAQRPEAESRESSASKGKPETAPRRNRCPICNRRVQPRWRFCPDCGASLETG